MSIIEESRRSKSNGVFGFWRNKKIIILIIGLLIAGGAYAFWPKQAKPDESASVPKEWIVKNDDIVVAIESDGKVVAEDGVELSFNISDDNLEVKEVYVKEGDKVKKGDKVALAGTDTLELSVRSAWSSYQSALADYNESIGGPSDEEVQAAKDKITNAELSLAQGEISLENTKQSVADSVFDAEQALKNAKKDWEDNQNVDDSETVSDAYEDLLDTIKSISITFESILPNSDKIIGVDDYLLNDDFELNLGVKETGSLSAARGSYNQAKKDKDELDAFVRTLTKFSSYEALEQSAQMAEKTLKSFEGHLYDMQAMLNASVTDANLTQAELDAFKSTINGNRNSVNTKITTLSAKIKTIGSATDAIDDYKDAYDEALRNLENKKAEAERSIANAESSLAGKKLSLEQAKRDLDDLYKPLTAAEMASAKSRLTSASISLQRAQNDLGKATIVSPIDGQVVELNYKAGDIIVDNASPVAVILNPNTLFIEVSAEEADVSNLEVGQKANAVFDALDSLKLVGQVSFISLTSETSNNGIVTYKVRVLIDNPGDNQIREGMTASISFIASEVTDVPVIPVAAVRNVNGSPSVQLKSGAWTPVTTGFTDGKIVEVISGVEAGDAVVY